MLVFSGSGRRATPKRWSWSLFFALATAGCIKLDNVFDCAALCDNRPHALTRCDGAGCIVAGCDDGYADCNQNSQDGCEVNLVSARDACGVCGNACQASDCSEGACWPVETLTDSTMFSRGIALDSDAVYFSANNLADAGPSLQGSGSLYRLPRSEGAQPTVIGSGLDAMEGIVLDRDAAYGFTTVFDFQPTTSGGTVSRTETRIFRIAKSGGTVTFLGSTLAFGYRPAVDDTDVYWATEIDADRDAGPLATLDASDAEAVGAIGPPHAFGIAHTPKLGGPTSTIVTPGVVPNDLVISNGTLFATGNGVQAVAIAAQTTTTLVPDTFTFHVLVDATHVYWITTDPATLSAVVLKSMPLTGGTPTVLWRDPTSDDRPIFTLQMVDDGDHIYVAQSTGSIVRIPKVPGAATVVAGQQPCLSGVAADDEYVYWSGCAGIRRVRTSAFLR